MKLFNQTDKNLRWDLAGKTFSCEPYGSVEVEHELVEHIKTRGLPLGVSSVTPEAKADVSLKHASDAARKDEIAGLQKQLTVAVANEKSVNEELEKSLASNVSLAEEKAGVSLELASVSEKYKQLVDDHGALNKLFEEQAKELAIKKEELERARAVVSEVKKAEDAKKTAPQQSQVKK